VIKRKLFSELKNHLDKKEISLIIGPRQAGKTTLMLLLKDYLEKKGEETLFLSLDIEVDRQFFTSQTTLIEKIQLELGRQRSFVFLDEIQRIENAGLFLKGIYDMDLPYKFIASGSGSFELKEKVHESLAGRKRIFELNTLSFEEFVNFETNYQYENRLTEFLTLDKIQSQRFLERYLKFGGYPKVVLAETLAEKEKTIDEIYRSYLERDITSLGVTKTEAFGSLIKVIASQTGNLTNFSELSSTLGISVQTVKNYLWYAEKTFILKKVFPYFKNARKEISKSPIFYFTDLGLRNFALGLFGREIDPQETGLLFQNFVFLNLWENSKLGSARIKFWRTKDGAEVDFVVNFTQEQVPIEVKFRKLKKPEISRSFRSFLSKYQPKRAFLINLELRKERKIARTKVFFIPYYLLLGSDPFPLKPFCQHRYKRRAYQ